MPNRDNSTAYWRRLVASITRRVQHACINHRGRRYRVAAISTVCLVAREPFCRRKPYQSEIRKGRNPRPAGRNRIYPWRRDVDHRVYTPGIWYLVRGSPNLFVCTGDENTRGISSGAEGRMGGDSWDLLFSLPFSFLIRKNCVSWWL